MKLPWTSTTRKQRLKKLQIHDVVDKPLRQIIDRAKRHVAWMVNSKECPAYQVRQSGGTRRIQISRTTTWLALPRDKTSSSIACAFFPSLTRIRVPVIS